MMPAPSDKPLKILIIDDEPPWCQAIGMYAEILGHTWKPAYNFEEAKAAIKEAEEAKTPFSVATIDMGFEVGKEGTPSPFRALGKGILRYIKSEHPYIACIMVTGSPEVAHELLELRDNYELDSYISKDRLDPDTFAEAIARAIKRVRSPGNKGGEMIDSTSWMNILAGAATVLYTEVGALLKERRKARQDEREAKEAEAAAPVPSVQPPLRDEAEMMAVLKQINLQQYQSEIDRVKSLQEIIGNLRRTLNDFEREANKPGLSIDERVGVSQKMEDTESKIIEYSLELQGLLEKISGRKIEV